MSTFISGNLDRNRALYLLTIQDFTQRGMLEHLPKPRWCKFKGDGDTLFVMTWMNHACADQFYTHCPPHKVIGHCDRICWGDEYAAHCLRVCVIGMGPIGNRHADMYQGDELAQLVGVCDIRQDRADAASVRVLAEYRYGTDRFKDRQSPTAVELLTGLGADETAGIAGRFMDRCADTLDYDSLIDRLRAALGGAGNGNAQQVLVEKSYASARDARFVLTARYNPQDGTPLMAAMQTLLQ